MIDKGDADEHSDYRISICPQRTGITHPIHFRKCLHSKNKLLELLGN